MRKIYWFTVTCWVLVVGICGYAYVHRRLHSPDAVPGYETMPSFQWAMFFIFRFPMLILLLAAVLFGEHWVSKRLPREQPQPPA